jgi:hypothetical protein
VIKKQFINNNNSLRMKEIIAGYIHVCMAYNETKYTKKRVEAHVYVEFSC